MKVDVILQFFKEFQILNRDDRHSHNLSKRHP
jgi:hypothetical protein